MVRKKQFTTGTGRSGAAKYFCEHLSMSQYYAGGMGLLRGKSFEHLGLNDREITLQSFVALEQNLHPVTGEKITPRTNNKRKEWWLNPKTNKLETHLVDNRRSGLDVTLVVPKTVSEVWMENREKPLGGAIMKAFVESVEQSMNFAETLTCTQVKRGGKHERRCTENMLYLSVIHEDARPVGSNVPDPLLHAHNYIFNLTWDEAEGRFKAIDLHDVVKFAETVDAVFLSNLERRITELGLGTERTADGRSFELTSVTPEGKALFSKRRNQILSAEFGNQERIETLTRFRMREASKLGKTLDYDRVKNEVRNELGKSLAQRKMSISLEEKMLALRAQMTPEIRLSMSDQAVKAAPRRNWLTREQAREAIPITAFENYSVQDELAIVRDLLRTCGGDMTLDEAQEFARGSCFIHLDGERHLTTDVVREEEHEMLERVKAGWNEYDSLVEDFDGMIRNEQIAASNNQRAACTFVLRHHDQYMDISGIAGSGKTSLLQEVVPRMKEAGHTVVLVAPTSASELNLQADFPEAITLQRFLYDDQLRAMLPKGTVIILDEVSMTSIPQFCKLSKFVEENCGRLIMCGDRDQHESPERGPTIRLLQDSKSVRSVLLTETYRAQVPWLKRAVLHLKAKKIKDAYRLMKRQGKIIEETDLYKMREDAVELHMHGLRAGKTSILASPVHTEAREAAEIVRARGKAEGLIDEVDHEITRIARVDADGIKLKDPVHYQLGRVLIFHTRVYGGFNPGEKWKILEREDSHKGPTFTVSNGNMISTFNPGDKGKWSVYDTETVLMSVGDQVRVTEGFREGRDRFRNNDIARIASITESEIVLDDGRRMSRDMVRLDQGVCITSYASQCRTVDQVVVLAPVSAFGEMHGKTFYVLVSRARTNAFILTDCEEALEEQIMRPGERVCVWDFENKKQKQKEITIAEEQLMREMLSNSSEMYSTEYDLSL